MDRPILRPALVPPEVLFADPQARGTAKHASASPNSKRRIRPGWKATIVRSESFARLRAIQKSTTDPAIDLSYLVDACLQMALDIGAEAIVQRALTGLQPNRTKP
ncbi:MAG: hypothetical protein Q8L49_09210 [Burkholderiaceae bacterium]|nr:hypothetical protein [Burkholderiaceae bacterium]